MLLKSCVFLAVVFCSVTASIDLNFLTDSPSAHCMDGTKPVYYSRKGYGTGLHKWIVYFKGGGWCFDIEQCYMRSKTELGSSKSSQPHISSPLFLSHEENINPLMFNWNTLIVEYCDGGSFAGNAAHKFKNETVYFRGKANREALFHHLLTQDMSSHQASVKNEQDGGQQHPITMAMATEVVLSGFSAGALGVLLGIDQVAHQIHALAAQRGNFNVTVRGLVDSGFFLEYNSDSPAEVTHRAQAAHDEAVTTRTIAINGNKNMDYAKAMRDVFTFMNISAGANAACLQAAHRAANSSHGFDSKSDCIFAANLIPHIKTPIFLIQPQFDSWQVLHIYSQTSTAQGVNEYGKQLVQQLKQVLFGASSVGHGAFVDSCFHHGVFNSGPLGRSTNDIDAAQLLALGMRDVGGELETDWNAAEAFARWYRHSLRGDVAQVRGEVPGLNWFFQDAKFPCKSCCLFSPRIARQSSSAMT